MTQIDMEMPMDCVECPLNDEYAECALLGEFVAKYGRLPDCPLREDETQRLKDEIRRLDNENAALRKMLTAAALVGREGW